jgi:hypothetical protein
MTVGIGPAPLPRSVSGGALTTTSVWTTKETRQHSWSMPTIILYRWFFHCAVGTLCRGWWADGDRRHRDVSPILCAMPAASTIGVEVFSLDLYKLLCNTCAEMVNGTWVRAHPFTKSSKKCYLKVSKKCEVNFCMYILC